VQKTPGRAERVNWLWLWLLVAAGDASSHMLKLVIASQRTRIRAFQIARLFTSLAVRVRVLIQSSYAVLDLDTAKTCEERARVNAGYVHNRRIETLRNNRLLVP
jgi:hypothetical protein